MVHLPIHLLKDLVSSKFGMYESSCCKHLYTDYYETVVFSLSQDTSQNTTAELHGRKSFSFGGTLSQSNYSLLQHHQHKIIALVATHPCQQMVQFGLWPADRCVVVSWYHLSLQCSPHVLYVSSVGLFIKHTSS